VLGDGVDRVQFERGSVDDDRRIFDLVGSFDPDEIVHLAAVLDPGVLVRNRRTAGCASTSTPS